jgi:midasin
VLLERVAVCVRNQEPVLLVGETGTGKTSSVQYLAEQLGNKFLIKNFYISKKTSHNFIFKVFF